MPGILSFSRRYFDFIEKVGRGAYDAAYKTYRNAVTFPAIVSALCHEPCKTNCPRKKLHMAAMLSNCGGWNEP